VRAGVAALGLRVTVGPFDEATIGEVMESTLMFGRRFASTITTFVGVGRRLLAEVKGCDVPHSFASLMGNNGDRASVILTLTVASAPLHNSPNPTCRARCLRRSVVVALTGPGAQVPFRLLRVGMGATCQGATWLSLRRATAGSPSRCLRVEWRKDG
jgi:hypothetical protein